MMKTLYNVLGSVKGDVVAKVYNDSLRLLDTGVSLDDINESLANVINSEFKHELSIYSNENYRVEYFVLWDMVGELQTYHYL